MDWVRKFSLQRIELKEHFCKRCITFAPDFVDRSAAMPSVVWRKQQQKVKKPKEYSNAHQTSFQTSFNQFYAETFDSFLRPCKNEANVRNVLSESSTKIIDESKFVLRHVINVVAICGRQALPLLCRHRPALWLMNPTPMTGFISIETALRCCWWRYDLLT